MLMRRGIALSTLVRPDHRLAGNVLRPKDNHAGGELFSLQAIRYVEASIDSDDSQDKVPRLFMLNYRSELLYCRMTIREDLATYTAALAPWAFSEY